MPLGPGSHTVSAKLTGDSKYADKEASTTFDVAQNNSTDNNGSKNTSKSLNDGNVVLSNYATGNPILALLLVLIAIGSSQIRRFKK